MEIDTNYFALFVKVTNPLIIPLKLVRTQPMSIKEKSKELSYYFLRLQNFNDISSYEYFQNLVIFLSAKFVIEERKKALASGTNIDKIFNSFLNTLSYEDVVDEYLDAAKELMPAMYNQFSLITILNSVFKLSTDDNGLDQCYSFLKLKEYDETRMPIYTLKSSKQLNQSYDSNGNQRSQEIETQNIVSFFKEGDLYELEWMDSKTKSRKRITGLKYKEAGYCFVNYGNDAIKIQLSGADPHFKDGVISVSVEDVNQKWIVYFK